MSYSAAWADKHSGPVEQLIQEYASGKTLQQLADARGVKHPAIWMRIRRRCGESAHRDALYQSLLVRIAAIEDNCHSSDPVTKARARKESRRERYRLSCLFPDLHPWVYRTRKSASKQPKSFSVQQLAK